MWEICKKWLLSWVRLFTPCRCAVCGDNLQEGEEGMCLACNIRLPRTGYHLVADNPVAQALWGKVPVVRASAFFAYRRGGDYAHAIHLLKYRGRKDLGLSLGRLMAAELLPSGFFEGVDVLLPVPLHPRRQRSRGYNQSTCIARGLSSVTGIPVEEEAVARDKHTESQTHKSVAERQDNVAGIFSLRHPESVAGKHVLIVDDVLTTGATVAAVADALLEAEGVRVSVLVLAWARG